MELTEEQLESLNKKWTEAEAHFNQLLEESDLGDAFETVVSGKGNGRKNADGDQRL
ncbi:MAG: hypothetical protein U5K84_14430 [Alkalibacterium sp.]|nr:hypothetical protein [Alkalibacterium sp.]